MFRSAGSSPATPDDPVSNEAVNETSVRYHQRRLGFQFTRRRHNFSQHSPAVLGEALVAERQQEPARPAPEGPRGPGWVLIGFRGSGKTTVGRALAERLGVPWVDTDEQIMRRAGRSIREIFADSGEPAFRELERAMIAELNPSPAKVVAVGGGAIEDRRNIARLRELGRIIWLDAPAAALAARIAADPETETTRPSLTGLNPADEVATVLMRRRPLYAQACDLRVDATSDTPTVIVEVILKAFPPAPA